MEKIIEEDEISFSFLRNAIMQKTICDIFMCNGKTK